MYRLYMAPNYRYTDENETVTSSLKVVLSKLDESILTKKEKGKYLLIENRNGTDEVLFFGFNSDEKRYLEYKKELIMKKGIEQHFIKEDSQFIDICMRRGECNGCKYEKMCEDIEKPKKSYIKGKK